MRPPARALLAAGLLLAGLRMAAARPAPNLRSPADRAASGLAALVRGPAVWPSQTVAPDAAGRLRTLELDDSAPLHLRLTIPF